MQYLIPELKISVTEIPNNQTLDKHLEHFISKRFSIPETHISSYEILNKSIDVRSKPTIYIVYKLVVSLTIPLQKNPKNLRKYQPKETINLNDLTVKKRVKNPIIVGTGPSSLMCALLLARHGFDPIVLDRGKTIEQRHDDIKLFYKTKELNPNSNILYGEGGAGTFSDGKLYTRTKDPLSTFIIDAFIKFGAPEEIRYLKRPHLGSNKLPAIIKGIREEILNLGGTFLWGKQVKSFLLKEGKCAGVILSDGEQLDAPFVISGTGHADRELIMELLTLGVDYRLKDFQIGSRIEHSQEFINMMQYQTNPPPHGLEAAEYNIISRPPKHVKAQNVSTFCMCPGGIIVPAISEKEHLSTNGMSNFERDSSYANSCLIVNQSSKDFKDAQHIFSWLRELEQKAFQLGGGEYIAPAQNGLDFVKREESALPTNTSYPMGITPGRIDRLLPKKTTQSIHSALTFFERRFKGFMTQGTLIGIETHISSPVRFLRNEETLSSSIDNLYIIGEGAGYASGIMSAGIDGLKIAKKIIEG